MGLIGWGIGLLILGIIVSVLLPGDPGGPIRWLGWILLGIGVILTVIALIMGAGAGRRMGRTV